MTTAEILRNLAANSPPKGRLALSLTHNLTHSNALKSHATYAIKPDKAVENGRKHKCCFTTSFCSSTVRTIRYVKKNLGYCLF